MTSEPTPVWRRLAESLAGGIVRLWPEDTKRWGLAFEAELSEITTPLASFRWLIGGFMLLSRERFLQFVKSLGRPWGVPSDRSLETLVRNSNRAPRTPRIVTLFLLLGAAAILLHPDVRYAIRSSMRNALAGYNEANWEPSRWSSTRQLRKAAERSRDPKLLALLSLLSIDEGERLKLSDEAIQEDSSLTWLDYEHSYWGRQDDSYRGTLPAERMERLQKWDPDNAAARELGVEALAQRMGTSWFEMFPHYYDGKVIEAKREARELSALKSQWLLTMDNVFVAPRYDSYSTRSFELIRYASEKYGVNDPDITLYILARQRIPNLLILRTYADWLLSRSVEAEQRGDIAGAREYAWKTLLFSQRMRLGQRTLIEWFVSSSIGATACKRLEPLLKERGQGNEASLIGFQLADWKAEMQQKRFLRNSSAGESREAVAWAGFTILAGTVLILLTSAVSLVSLVFLWLKRRSAVAVRGRFYPLMSWFLDLAPIVLLGACAVMFLAYQPFARTYHTYFSAHEPVSDFEGLFNAGIVTHSLPEPVARAADPVLGWTIATVLLSLLAVVLLVRMALRRRRQA